MHSGVVWRDSEREGERHGMKERSTGSIKSLELSLGGVGRDSDTGLHFVVLLLSPAGTQETGMKPA